MSRAEPSKASLREMPERLTGWRRTNGELAAAIAREGLEAGPEGGPFVVLRKPEKASQRPPSKASLRAMPEADFTRPGWRRNTELAEQIQERASRRTPKESCRSSFAIRARAPLERHHVAGAGASPSPLAE